MTSKRGLPTVSAYDLLVSPENFGVAWERVRYCDRPDTRDWIGLKVFAANKDYNLEMLRQSVIERTFEASFPEVRYVPKPSLTLRPMAMLAVGDRVVFQALANAIAERARSTLAMVANRQSFANVLSSAGTTQFFVPWKLQYRRFQDKFCELIKEGSLWVAETDLAAFYETIDHRVLFSKLLERGFVDDRVLEHLQAHLPVWSSVKSATQATRGVPQGCMASDLLANVFLYDLDHQIGVQEYHYLRYVDDIRVLARTKQAVQRGLIRIDTTLKSMGLLLQTKKTIVRQVTDLDEEVDRLAAQLSELDSRLKEPELQEPPPLDPLLEPSLIDVAFGGEEPGPRTDPPLVVPAVDDELKALFWTSKEAIDAGNADPFSERHLRFSLYRLQPDPEITAAVMPLLTDYPWLGEIAAAYLRRCTLGKGEIEQLQALVRTYDVYDHVTSLAISVLLQQKASLRPLHDLFRRWLMNGERGWPLLCSAASALGESSDNMLTLIKSMELPYPSVRRMAMIQALRLARDEDEAVHIFRKGISDPSPLVCDALLYQLYNEWGLDLASLGLDDASLSDYCRTCAKGYDTTLPAVQPDYVRAVLARAYSVQFSATADFHVLLGADYARVAEFLWQAQNSYLVNPSRYVSQLDLFHEELLYPILVDRLKWKHSRDEVARVELPDRMKHLLADHDRLKSFASALLECHQLRCSCTEAHTRLYHQTIATNPITWRQRDGLRQRLAGGYQQLADWL